MNQPATFVHWSIFDVTVANLVLIAVMVAIFGAALLLPFPKGHRVEAATVADSARTALRAPTWPVRPNCPMTARPACGRPGFGAAR